MPDTHTPAPPSQFTAVVITVSDSVHRGQREDRSGPAVGAALAAKGFVITGTEVVPDDRTSIENCLIEWADKAHLVVTTGGTGLAARDVTPEATHSVCDRFVPGIPEQIRFEGFRRTPYAALSRGLCGIRNGTLILNLPGSPKAAAESLATVVDMLPHALDLLQGRTAHEIAG